MTPIDPATIQPGDVLGVGRFGDNGFLYEVFVQPNGTFLCVADYDSSVAVGKLEPSERVLANDLYLLSRRNV